MCDGRTSGGVKYSTVFGRFARRRQLGDHFDLDRHRGQPFHEDHRRRHLIGEELLHFAQDLLGRGDRPQEDLHLHDVFRRELQMLERRHQRGHRADDGRFGQPAVLRLAGQIGHAAARQHGRIGAQSRRRPRPRSVEHHAVALVGAGGDRVDGTSRPAMRQGRQHGGDRRAHRRIQPLAQQLANADDRRRRQRVDVEPDQLVQARPASCSTASRLSSTCSICSSTEPSPTSCPPRPAAATAGYGPAARPGRSRPATCRPGASRERIRSAAWPPPLQQGARASPRA
jgi:hypothetical protein